MFHCQLSEPATYIEPMASYGGCKWCAKPLDHEPSIDGYCCSTHYRKDNRGALASELRRLRSLKCSPSEAIISLGWMLEEGVTDYTIMRIVHAMEAV